jgi:murein L,D-transpeptidase YcbB/YkuD
MNSFSEGMNPDFYNLVDIEIGLENLRAAYTGGNSLTPERVAWLEMLMTDAFFAYAKDILTGRLKPRMVVEDGREGKVPMELTGFLMRMLRVGWIKDSLESLSPKNPEYQRLKKALARYMLSAKYGGWKSITTQMKQGDYGSGVVALRRRLEASGDLTAMHTSRDEKLFDATVTGAVKRFQRRYGLNPDGMVGPLTLKTLNIPVENRIRAIELNMERLRWLPGDLDTYVLVNLANFTLKMVKKGETAGGMKVIIGKQFKSTPTFGSSMTSIELNPAWNIPDSITREDLYPRFSNSPSYLAEHDIKILKGWDSSEEVVDSNDIDIEDILDSRKGLRLRQSPGGSNPLGRVKFLMPNRFEIYLHDTPAEYLFEKEVRTFSHGCIRVEKPVDLAAFVMGSSPRWTRNKLLAAIKTGDHYALNLPESVNILVVYLTAWADEQGNTMFRNDVYGRDAELDAALRRTVRIPAGEPAEAH